LQPNLKRIGLIYNPSEANSVVIVKRLKEIAPSLGVEIILQAANKTSDVPQAATSLVNKVDAIFISNDNTAFAAIAGIIAIATKANIPVYVSDTDAVSLGALAAMGPNQYNIGLQSAKMIVKVLKGENIGGLPVEFPITKEIYINEQALKKFGITLPKNIKANMVRAK
jgi:putative ABC transport system substrate-binding protein